MLKIVHTIFQSTIGKFCAFKGGTLALFIYSLDRFSTDVDLDLLDISQEEKVVAFLNETLKSFGRVKNMTVWKTLHRRIISYDDTSMNIKIELNKRIRENNHYEIKSIYGVDCKVMSPISMATNKLIALYERMANRDLYDTWFFRDKGREYDEKLITERTKWDKHTLIYNLIHSIPKYYQKNNILFQLGELLTEKQKIRVKSQLISSTVQLLQFYNDIH